MENNVEEGTPVDVSIVTPAYNCVSTFKETFESVISQSFQNWEWIIVDDNSSDDSFAYIKQLVKDDSRIVVLQNEQNLGAAGARNRGIELSKGRYIAFIDADDIWEKSKLEVQIKFMQANGYGFSFSDYNLLFPNGKIKQFTKGKDEITYKSLLAGNDIGCLTVIYDTGKIGKRYMPMDCPKREDYGCWLDITKEGIVAHKLNLILATYRLSNNSVSSNKVRIIKYHYSVYKKHEKFNFLKSLYCLARVSFNKLFKY